MNDIALLCRDTRFCRMLELELRASGYSVVCNPRGGSARLWVIDLDSVLLQLAHTERVYIGFSRKPDAIDQASRLACLNILARPFDVSKMLEIVNTLLSPDRVPISAPKPSAHLLHTPLGYELDGEPLSLTATEECILSALYRQRGQTLSRADLCAMLGNDTNEKLADVYICLLRRKLESGGHPRLIFTVRGVGYRLEAEP